MFFKALFLCLIFAETYGNWYQTIKKHRIDPIDYTVRISVHKEASLLKCVDACRTTEGCKSANWDEIRLDCHLFPVALSETTNERMVCDLDMTYIDLQLTDQLNFADNYLLECNNNTCWDNYAAIGMCVDSCIGRVLKCSPVIPYTCYDIKTTNPHAPTGIYTVTAPTSEDQTIMEDIQVFCDMETAGGGWTLVWRFGWDTKIGASDYTSASSAVKPTPRFFAHDSGWDNVNDNTGFWTLPELSETPPGESPTDFNAISWPVWKHFGEKNEQFMVKSNMVNWFVCTSNPGNPWTDANGNCDCELIKIIPGAHERTSKPDEVYWTSYGLSIRVAGTHFIYMDVSESAEYPVTNLYSSNANRMKFLAAWGELYLR